MSSKMKIIMAMLIYGSIGVFVRGVNLSAIQIAFLRACIGSLFLIAVGLGKKGLKQANGDQENLYIFALSGGLLGINWFFLFKAFEYTTISSAVLVYYLAPIIVILLSPFAFGERLTLYKTLCAAVALLGLVLVVFNDFAIQFGREHLTGIGFSLLAAVFYASVIIINKKYAQNEGIRTTTVQLVASAGVLMPILFMSGGHTSIFVQGKALWMVLILGIVHTGIAYLLYFSSMKGLDGQTIAIFCYIDPISAMAFAWIFLGEWVNYTQAVGGVLILGATYFIDLQSDEALVVD